MQGEDVPHIVSFYMTTNLPAPVPKQSPTLLVVDYQIPGRSSKAKATKAVRCSFDPRAALDQTPCLLSIGSDSNINSIVLDASIASPVHCRVYAQLNSGCNMLIIEDLSHAGTNYHGISDYKDTKGKPIHFTGTVRLDCKAVASLKTLKIGPYVFTFHPPKLAAETEQRDRWFRRNEPLLVTKEMLQVQLQGAKEQYMTLGRLGEGGQGEVFESMETHTGLLLAVKVQRVGSDNEALRQEIKTMKVLQHVSGTTAMEAFG